MGSDQGRDQDAISGLSSLDDPVRRRLYEYVRSRDEPVARDDAAAAAGISRTLAAYHLDKLAEAGLLATSYARAAGRGGPGAGRPAKRYARAQRELSASVPPRDYGLLAGVLAEAIAADDTGAVQHAMSAAAYQAGRAASDPDLHAALRACGYEPSTTADGDVELRNCPFHQLARRHTDLVCGLNLHLIRGLLDGSAPSPARAVLAPRPGRCCVRILGAPISADPERQATPPGDHR
ncbi:putative ArsR family transcriptional regulator [Amycolatopsis echigonensis]|uniref:ArsR family transcriptional regulator n=1 Tax=Amycolatopsis echigonensis TaxID=2576905 RepID=A0A2N3X1C8_9PSEU|nr:helix-turn-helix domain-containing protein [Amycolatopsis niigatensis]PKV99925.1 putative ArsR family transcriptional regulator [Amycolatopsis niigatensis]